MVLLRTLANTSIDELVLSPGPYDKTLFEHHDYVTVTSPVYFIYRTRSFIDLDDPNFRSSGVALSVPANAQLEFRGIQHLPRPSLDIVLLFRFSIPYRS